MVAEAHGDSKSTDFEVHRNWLAITHSLFPQDWYFEKTSPWTLDYPPFFAYFEWTLSQLARFADHRMLAVEDLGYESWQTVFFQRATVIATELGLAFALHRYVVTASPASKQASHTAALSILLSPGLLIIDHIHFQYNGFLYGLLVLSLVLARQPSTLLYSGIIFAALLCFKHIYLYLAPAFFVYLLRAYCLRSFFPRFAHCFKLAASLIAIFGAALGPFVYWGQAHQLLRRLFPFSRGLCHAYWAPNIWALYSFVDRVLIYGTTVLDHGDAELTNPVAPTLGLHVDQSALNSVTRGLVGDTSFAVLPEISPRTTFILTLFFQLVSLFFVVDTLMEQIGLVKLFFQPSWDTFIGAVTLCGYASFLFGWHVHEKAILLVIIPFSLIAITDRRYLGAFRPLAVSGHVSLFPLLFTRAEYPVKSLYTIFWLLMFLVAFDRLAPASSQSRVFLLDRASLLYTAMAAPLVLYPAIHGAIFGSRLEFLPLMLMSSYSAIGVVGSWMGFLVVYFNA